MGQIESQISILAAAGESTRADVFASRLRDIDSSVTAEMSPSAELLLMRPWLAIVSSHFGKGSELHTEACRYLSRSMLEIRQRKYVLLVAQRSAIEPWLVRAAELFDVPLIHVVTTAPGALTKNKTARRQQRSEIRVTGETELCRDQVVITLADRIDCVFARSGGRIHRAIRGRLQTDQLPCVRLAIHSPAIDRGAAKTAQELMDQGAIGWYCQRQSPAKSPPRFDPPTESHAADLNWTKQEGQWLVHCTRSRCGAWPGQTEQQYRDEVLLGQALHFGFPDRSPLEALQRILRKMRINASALTSCHKKPVVCFSETPLASLLSRRSYRSHLHRWDYEPYGIAIRKTVAAQLGFQSVIYGEPDERKGLDEADQFRFQAKGKTHDWTLEQEWRSPQDVTLDRFSTTDVRVFVATNDEAASLHCPYQVFAVGDLVKRSSGS